MDLNLISIDTPLEVINQLSKNGLVGSLGIKFTKIGKGLIEGEFELSDKNCRPDGILHGGANLAMAETFAGFGSMLLIDFSQYDVLGIQINGSHTGILKKGKALGRAEIIHQGRQTHVWNINISNENGKLISSVRVTNMIVKRDD